MQAYSNHLLFVGPTLHGLSAEALEIARRFELHPPVQRGDVEALMSAAPGVIVLVDGLFHDSLAVGHLEIRNAVAQGWQVWGLSSMGAIRAYEMRTLGVRGYGRIYERFYAEEDFQDDEVALLHSPPPDYTPITEPLVHLRAALDAYVGKGLLEPIQRDAIVRTLKSLWYGDRTLDLFFRLLHEHVGSSLDSSIPDSSLLQLRAEFASYRLKTHDLESFLLKQIWMH